MHHSIRIMFYGHPATPEIAEQLKEELIQKLSPALEKNSPKLIGEKGEIFPKVNFITIEYEGAAVDHDFLQWAFEDALNAVSSTLSLHVFNTSEKFFGNKGQTGSIFKICNTFCEIDFEPRP